MKLVLLLPFIFLISPGCDRNLKQKEVKIFDNLVYSHSELYSDYSIRLTNGDTVFLQIRFPASKGIFYSIIQQDEKKVLDSFLNKIDLSKYDTTYIQQNIEDAGSYKFYLAKDNRINWILIYGNEGPKKLYDFAGWLDKLKERQKFRPLDSAINFGNLDYILLPQVSPPPMKNSR